MTDAPTVRLSERVAALVGREHPLITISSSLRDFVRSLAAPVVGAYQVCCSDESEKEAIATFHLQFVRHLLPELKHFSRSAFRTINLGGRYECGALAIAEHHYATPESEESFKVIAVKINSHVAAAGRPDGRFYGRMPRYDRHSLWCGALHAMLEGSDLPAIGELSQTFGAHRLATLRDLDDPQDIALRMAIANSVLQTQVVSADVDSFEALTPTIYVIASCVTFNREREDTELLAGLTLIDSRLPEKSCQNVSLAADPAAYRFSYSGPFVTVSEESD